MPHLVQAADAQCPLTDASGDSPVADDAVSVGGEASLARSVLREPNRRLASPTQGLELLPYKERLRSAPFN